MTKNAAPRYWEHNASSPEETNGTVTCVICHAVYAPSQLYEYLLQAPSVALESAFMGMCHFCFRCRRPACPHCWDEVHGVCAACAQDARLPFRADAGPLSGTLFVSSQQPQKEQAKPDRSPLVCVRYGRYQQAIGEKKASTDDRSPLSSATSKAKQRTPHQKLAITAQPVMPSRTFDLEIADIDTQPPARSKITELKTQPPAPQKKKTTRTPRRFVHRFIEIVLTIVLLLILFLIIAMVSMALLSSNANLFIADWLHVDIQTEIAYLLQLIRYLH